MPRDIRTAWKAVRCITPEAAAELGIPAETPVFISPYIRTPEDCPTCGATFSPLVYAPGHVTQAQHHFWRCPGIWHVHAPRPAAAAWARNGCLRPQDVILRGRVRCRGDGDCDGSAAFWSQELFLRCWRCAGRRTPIAADGTWRWGRLFADDPRGAPRSLVPLCLPCAAEVSALRRTPWVAILRDGQLSWDRDPAA